jgi:hypothetical protein
MEKGYKGEYADFLKFALLLVGGFLFVGGLLGLVSDYPRGSFPAIIIGGILLYIWNVTSKNQS